MKEHYFEYRVTTPAFKEQIESFLMDRFYNGIEEAGDTLILRSEEPLGGVMDELRGYVKSLEELFETPIDLRIEVEKKVNEDWIEKYKRSITPVEVGSFYIHPGWHPPKKGKINIEIEPALAFGSGHHETTRGCLAAIDELVGPGMEVLDVGCGSGILGIAAAKKGAVVDICDTDELAVEEAGKNFAKNGAAYRRAWVGSAAGAQEKYDIVIANIVADVLVMIAKDLKNALKPGATLVLSGIIEKYQDKVAQAFGDLAPKKVIAEGEWRTMLFTKDADG